MSTLGLLPALGLLQLSDLTSDQPLLTKACKALLIPASPHDFLQLSPTWALSQKTSLALSSPCGRHFGDPVWDLSQHRKCKQWPKVP
jgi:hypothetical protein